MQVGDGMPGQPLRWAFAEHVVPCGPHLGRAAAGGHSASRCGEPGQRVGALMHQGISDPWLMLTPGTPANASSQAVAKDALS